MKSLIVSDGKPGHANQAKTLCGWMGWKYREIVVRYPFGPVKAAAYALDWIRAYTTAPFVMAEPNDTAPLNDVTGLVGDCTVVTAVGSAAYYPAKVLARKTKLPVIALMYPSGFRKDFDHILCPAYDNPPKKPNITALPITLCGSDAGFYEAMAREFGQKVAYRLPAVGVIIGGDNKYERLCPDRLREQLEQIFALTPNHQHWVTTSRRTCQAAEDVVEQFEFDYRLIYSKQHYNPIPAFLALCDRLFVTSDSSSMISECVCTGQAKVEVLKNITQTKNKFDVFLRDLQARGCVHLFDGSLGQADRKIDVAQTVREALANLADGRRPDSEAV